MMRALNSAILASLVFLFGVIAFAVLESSPSTEELDSDLADVRQAITQANDLRQKYEGGAIKSFVELNYQILSSTESMLLQKRSAVLRRVQMSYRIDGHAIEPATSEALKAIRDDLAEAQKKADVAQVEADRYTGGLVQAMALMKVQTEQLSVSMLNLKYYSAKYGIGLTLPTIGATAPAAKEPPGRIVKDKDAL
jgi:hypothetical protein